MPAQVASSRSAIRHLPFSSLIHTYRYRYRRQQLHIAHATINTDYHSTHQGDMTESHIPLLDVQAEHRTVQDLDMELREAAVDLYSILHSIAWSRLEDSIEDESRFKNSKLLKDCVIDCDKAASTLFGFDNKSNLISVRTNTLGKAESFSNLMKRDGDEEIQTALGEDASGLLAGMARRVRSLASLPPTKMPAAITW